MNYCSRIIRFCASITAVLCILGMAADISAQMLSPDVLKAIQYRSIGPTPQSGRFVDFAVPELNSKVIYAATGSGGLWKSTNYGLTFDPIFDNQAVVSIGDVAVAPSDPNVVWVGSGEATSSRSTYWGDGVYKSTDAGLTWTNMGLKESHHIGRIVIHPKDPNIVYVAALGHLYTENEGRGVYKTTDGGKTWVKSLGVVADNKNIGACDIVIDPKNPNTLYAATYDKERKDWTFNLGGPGSGIYKTTDAGRTWTKLTNGLPGGMLGRIGLDIYPKNPNILYANIEDANKPGMSDADRLKELRAGKSSSRMIGEQVYRTDDGGKTWRLTHPPNENHGGGPGYYYMQIRVDPNNPDHVMVLSVSDQQSTDGGKTWTRFFSGGDNHGLWIDPKDSDHMLLGYDHGMMVTWDGGRTSYHPDNLPLAQFYAVGYDMAYPYNVAGGLQDNGSYMGPSTKRRGAIRLEDWKSVGGGDGMYNVFDPVTNRYLYNESQNGSISRLDLVTGESRGIRYQGEGSRNFRYNWCAPILVSPNNSDMVYLGANVLLRSPMRGEYWEVISPDLSKQTPDDSSKMTTGKGGDGNIQYSTITTVDESSIISGLIYVGTDDGNVQVTKDAGRNWIKLNEKITGNPNYWVSRVLTSKHFAGTAYVTYTGLRNDDFRPFIYKTTDFGETWTSVAGNLPNKSINVVREDHKNPNLLFVGVDFGIYFTIDGGKNWNELRSNMPTQPVHDLQIHPRENDLIVGTHGRGIFIADISPLQELNQNTLSQDVYLFDIESKVKWVTPPEGESASINYNGQSEPNGVVINYYLRSAVQDTITVRVLKGARVVAETKNAIRTAGINQVIWNMTMNRETIPLPIQPVTGGRGGAGAGGRGGIGAGGAGAGGAGAFGGRGGQGGASTTFGGQISAPPGEYTVVINAAGKTLSKKAVILEDVWYNK